MYCTFKVYSRWYGQTDGWMTDNSALEKLHCISAGGAKNLLDILVQAKSKQNRPVTKPPPNVIECTADTARFLIIDPFSKRS